MNNNKNKGKSYERQLAKQLTEIFGFNFERVPNSGAFIGGKNIVRAAKLSNNQLLAASGDIMTPDELSHVDFECKFYKELAFSSLFDNCEILNKWVEQARHTVKTIWFLCIKINHKGEFIVFDKKHTKLYNDTDTFLTYRNNNIFIKGEGFFLKNKQLIIENTTL